MFREEHAARNDIVQHRRIHDRAGEEQDNHERGEDEDAHPDAQHPEETAFLLRLPDVVEHAPDREHQPDEDPQEGSHADEAEQAGFRRRDNLF